MIHASLHLPPALGQKASCSSRPSINSVLRSNRAEAQTETCASPQLRPDCFSPSRKTKNKERVCPNLTDPIPSLNPIQPGSPTKSRRNALKKLQNVFFLFDVSFSFFCVFLLWKIEWSILNELRCQSLGLPTGGVGPRA